MRSRYQVLNPLRSHFVTSTIVEWLPVFTSAKTCDILVHALAWYQVNKGLKIYAWVILENHFHAILQHDDLPRVMADLKKFTARQLVAHWEETRQEWLLNQLAYFKLKHKGTSEHQVWQEGYHPQQILDDAMMLQKLEYLHLNPVRRGLVVEREHWRYSSAHRLLTGRNRSCVAMSGDEALRGVVRASESGDSGTSAFPIGRLGTRGTGVKNNTISLLFLNCEGEGAGKVVNHVPRYSRDAALDVLGGRIHHCRRADGSTFRIFNNKDWTGERTI